MHFSHLQIGRFDFRQKADAVRPVIKRYLVIYEQGQGNLTGCVPDVPGCSGTGRTLVEMRESLYGALESHLESLARKGEPLPEPTIGFDDVAPGTAAEWMTARLRLGSTSLSPLALVRPFPEREHTGRPSRAISNAIE